MKPGTQVPQVTRAKGWARIVWTATKDQPSGLILWDGIPLSPWSQKTLELLNEEVGLVDGDEGDELEIAIRRKKKRGTV